MAGTNAFAFTGSAFVPEDRSLTATIKARSNATSFSGVSRAYTISESGKTQFWIGYPPAPTITSITNSPTGTFPNKSNSITVNWSIDESTITSGFDIYVAVGGGGHQKVNPSRLAANARSYTYGSILQDTVYSFIVTCVSVADLITNSSASTTSLSTPAAPTGLTSSAQTTSSITWSWTVPEDTFQSYQVQSSVNGIDWQQSVSVAGSNAIPAVTTFTYQLTPITENTTRHLRVRGFNMNGHWSAWTSASSATTTNAPPPTPSIAASYVAVGSSPRYTNTGGTVTRTINTTVTPSADPTFLKIELLESSDNINWSIVQTWSDNTSQKTLARNYSVTTEGAASLYRWFKCKQYDTYGGSTESSVTARIDMETRYSTFINTYASDGQKTVTKNGHELAMWTAYAHNKDGSPSYRSPEGTYGWAKTWDSSASSNWISDPYTVASDPCEGWWGFFIQPDVGFSKLWNCTINYYEFLTYRTVYQVFCQLYDNYSNNWHGTANEPTGCNGLDYVVYKASCGNQSTYTRANMGIGFTYGNTNSDTGLTAAYWDCRICMRNNQYESAYGQRMYSIMNFRVNYTYSNQYTITTYYYW